MEATQMVKSKNKDKRKRRKKQGRKPVVEKAKSIGPSTPYGYTEEKLPPYGGLLASLCAKPPKSSRQLFFIKGFVFLLFIGFKRIYHFSYNKEDAMLVGILGGEKLPHISTFWRYLKSIGINQAKALLRIIAALRERSWHALGYDLKSIDIDIDTTVETI